MMSFSTEWIIVPKVDIILYDVGVGQDRETNPDHQVENQRNIHRTIARYNLNFTLFWLIFVNFNT